VVRNLIMQGFKIRNRTNVGSLTAAMSADNTVTVTNDNASNVDFTLNFTNKDYAGGYRFNTVVDKVQWKSGNGTISSFFSALSNLNFGTISAGASTAISTGATYGVGDSVIVTWADTTANLPNGLILTPSIDFSSGLLYVVATNTTAGSLVVGTKRIRYSVMRHF
jgi:hypothetical protein